MKCLKKITNLALANEWITKDPFVGIKFHEKEVVREFLTMDELLTIYHKDFPSMSQFESKGNDDLYSGSIGLFMPDNANAQADENDFEGQLKRKDKKKKQRKIKF